MPSDLVLAVDAGSTMVKVGLLDGDGSLIAVASRPLPALVGPAGIVEHDMDGWADEAFATICEIARTDIGGRVASVGLCGQGDGCWLLDRCGRPVRRAISWRDGRARSVSAVFPGSTIALLEWLVEREPEALARARNLVFAKDWLRYRLTGILATDPSDAAGLRAAVEAGAAQPRVLEEAERLCPAAHASAEVVGYVTEHASAHTGLLAGIPVVTGALDAVAAVLGTGAVAVGDSVSVLGTAGIHTKVAALGESRCGESVTVPYLVADTNLYMMGQAAASLNVEWLLRTWYEGVTGEARDKMFLDAARLAPGAEGLLYHPYIGASGERAPFTRTSARAQFFGLSEHHTRTHLLRAVLEGIALATRDCHEYLGLRADHVILAGGLATSSACCQLIADVLGAEVWVGATFDAGLRGAAALAGVGAGIWPDARTAVLDLQVPPARYFPDPFDSGFYDDLFGLYRDLRIALEPYWDRWQASMSRSWHEVGAGT